MSGARPAAWLDRFSRSSAPPGRRRSKGGSAWCFVSRSSVCEVVRPTVVLATWCQEDTNAGGRDLRLEHPNLPLEGPDRDPGVATTGGERHRLPHLRRWFALPLRSEERRVGKECRSRWSPYH